MFINRVTVQYADMETKLNAVERIEEYASKPEEAPAVVPDCRPPEGWPARGDIVFRNVAMRCVSGGLIYS